MLNRFFATPLFFALSIILPSFTHAELIDDSKTLVMTEETAREYYAQTFASREASWRVKPNFKFPKDLHRRSRPGETYKITLRLLADKQGNIKATVLKSSGNRAFDLAAVKAFQKGKVNPFLKDGKPVIGKIIQPVAYKIH